MLKTVEYAKDKSIHKEGCLELHVPRLMNDVIEECLHFMYMTNEDLLKRAHKNGSSFLYCTRLVINSF